MHKRDAVGFRLLGSETAIKSRYLPEEQFDVSLVLYIRTYQDARTVDEGKEIISTLRMKQLEIELRKIESTNTAMLISFMRMRLSEICTVAAY